MQITVPQISAGTDASYTVVVAFKAAVKAGANALEAYRVGRAWYYRADETNEVYRLTSHEVAEYGAGKLDERGVNYSLWCSQTGRLIKRPSKAVRAALGMDN